jgi:hypothetical protein
VDAENGTGLRAFDIEVCMDDAALKAKMNAVHAPGDTKRLAALDEEVGADDCYDCYSQAEEPHFIDCDSRTIHPQFKDEARLPQLICGGPTNVRSDMAREPVP